MMSATAQIGISQRTGTIQCFFIAIGVTREYLRNFS
jgi:hypothetical protein